MTIPPELLDELLKDYQSPPDPENGIIKQLTRAIIECCQQYPTIGKSR